MRNSWNTWNTCVEALLCLRRRQETAARQAFLHARARLERARRRLDGLARTLAAQDIAARRAILSGEVRLPLEYRVVAGEARLAMGRQRRRLPDLTQEVELRRQRLIEAMRRRKVIGLLRNQVAAREALTRRRADVKEVDEMHAAFRAGVMVGPGAQVWKPNAG